jgi:hypothetical protein
VLKDVEKKNCESTPGFELATVVEITMNMLHHWAPAVLILGLAHELAHDI